MTATISNGEVTADFGDLNINASVTLTITVGAHPGGRDQLADGKHGVHRQQRVRPELHNGDHLGVREPREHPVGHHVRRANPVFVGSNLTYTIVATNSGPSTDPAVVVSDVSPAT